MLGFGRRCAASVSTLENTPRSSSLLTDLSDASRLRREKAYVLIYFSFFGIVYCILGLIWRIIAAVPQLGIIPLLSLILLYGLWERSEVEGRLDGLKSQIAAVLFTKSVFDFLYDKNLLTRMQRNILRLFMLSNMKELSTDNRREILNGMDIEFIVAVFRPGALSFLLPPAMREKIRHYLLDHVVRMSTKEGERVEQERKRRNSSGSMNSNFANGSKNSKDFEVNQKRSIVRIGVLSDLPDPIPLETEKKGEKEDGKGKKGKTKELKKEPPKKKPTETIEYIEEEVKKKKKKERELQNDQRFGGLFSGWLFQRCPRPPAKYVQIRANPWLSSLPPTLPRPMKIDPLMHQGEAFSREKALGVMLYKDAHPLFVPGMPPDITKNFWYMAAPYVAGGIFATSAVIATMYRFKYPSTTNSVPMTIVGSGFAAMLGLNAIRTPTKPYLPPSIDEMDDDEEEEEEEEEEDDYDDEYSDEYSDEEHDDKEETEENGRTKEKGK